MLGRAFMQNINQQPETVLAEIKQWDPLRWAWHFRFCISFFFFPPQSDNSGCYWGIRSGDSVYSFLHPLSFIIRAVGVALLKVVEGVCLFACFSKRTFYWSIVGSSDVLVPGMRQSDSVMRVSVYGYAYAFSGSFPSQVIVRCVFPWPFTRSLLLCCPDSGRGVAQFMLVER